MNPLPNGQPRLNWLFLDLNSYFASVEQELRPELRGRPVAVVPLLADTTCCIAASYEAKEYGIRTGTQVGEAKRLCPNLILVEARHELYVDYHRRVVEAVECCIPVTSVMSIDEMACRLIGREQPLLAALELAREVKASIRRKAGATLCCSVGLAPNRYLAKVASDLEKPDGLVALTPDLLHDALSGLKTRDLPGVGARMEKRLAAQGIQTVGQLLALERGELDASGAGLPVRSSGTGCAVRTLAMPNWITRSLSATPMCCRRSCARPREFTPSLASCCTNRPCG